MKKGITLQELATEIARQKKASEDYVVKSSKLYMETSGTELTLRVLDDKGDDRIEPLGIGVNAHRQIGRYLSIPQAYYEKMQSDNPELLGVNVNDWFSRSEDLRMLRVLDGNARAFLSNRYKRIDNYDVAQAVLPIISGISGVRIDSCNITENRMYIKAVNPRLKQDVVPGDTVQSGVIVSNSEVGLGAVIIQPLVYRLVCENGMVVNDAATRKNHLGRVNSDDENFLLYSDETIKADDRAFILKMQDTVRAAVDEARFSTVVDKMREAANIKMNTAHVPDLVRLASRDFGITEAEEKGVLQHLIEGGDLSLYGLSNAVTRYSQDVESYDRATDLEGIGYKILKMPPLQWKRINTLAA